ncbi:MAG: aromatic amino acid lyase [Ignavibacteriaceae bacterium]|nr:aromatic amino acid lyase [Ignavibacteriaceae bacterium]
MPDQHQLILDGESLTLEPLIKAALSKGEDFNIAVTKEKKTVDKILKSRKYVEDKLKNGTKHIYGVNTGFGANKHKYIYGATPEEKADNMKRLTYNLLISHCTGMGDKYPREVVRAAIILRINALAKGHSGVRMELLNLLAGLLNNDITPVVPSQGSVGASGDLAPLSHMAVVLALNPDKPEDIVFGDVEIPDNDTYRVCSAQDVRGLINPVVLEAKEGLALNNGTCFITALASFALSKTINAAKAAHISSVLSLEALLGTKDSLNPGIHNLRRHPGQARVASNMLQMLEGSNLIFNPDGGSDYELYTLDTQLQLIEKELGLINEIKPVKEPIQDNYSLRCIPQVMGACLDTINYVKRVLETEMNSVNDNPLLFPEWVEEGSNARACGVAAISGGNFHGEPVALAADFLKIAAAEIASLAERRTFLLTDPALNRRLPAFLSKPDNNREEGMHSGLMILQYTAASVVSENKVLCHPASVDSIPTSANVEDHVSMGTSGAKRAIEVAENVNKVIALELLCAAQALHLRLRQGFKYLYKPEERKRLIDKEETDTLFEKLELLIPEEMKPGKSSRIMVDILDKILVKENGLEFPITNDLYIAPHIKIVTDSLLSGRLVREFEAEFGEIELN